MIHGITIIPIAAILFSKFCLTDKFKIYLCLIGTI